VGNSAPASDLEGITLCHAVKVFAAAGSDAVVRFIERFTGPWLYVVAFVLTFAETGTLFFLIPGEIGLLVTGAAAGAGNLNIYVLVVVACVAAVLGDATGFYIGDRFGHRLQHSWLGRKLGESNWLRAQDLVRRRKGPVILIGRWIGFLRAIMPATAGMSEMSYREFLRWDVVGATSWATVCAVGGYKLGANWQDLADKLSRYSTYVAAVCATLLAVYLVVRKVRNRTAA
jgi:membrane-associated protein